MWQALRAIPRGETRTYGQLARELGDPKATRAVARACAMNRVALVVPCHRVIGAGGSLTGYRWGVDRKQKLLEAEGSEFTVISSHSQFVVHSFWSQPALPERQLPNMNCEL